MQGVKGSIQCQILADKLIQAANATTPRADFERERDQAVAELERASCRVAAQ